MYLTFASRTMTAEVAHSKVRTTSTACWFDSGSGSECYFENPKTVNTRIISGMLLCCEEKANQMEDEKTTNRNSN